MILDLDLEVVVEHYMVCVGEAKFEAILVLKIPSLEVPEHCGSW